ncbi:MAG: prolipoprotein diacylglyceryl transferase family protein [Bacillota bacterium]
MNKIAFTTGPLQVYWCGIFAAAAMLVCYVLTCRNARKYGMNVESFSRIIFPVFA